MITCLFHVLDGVKNSKARMTINPGEGLKPLTMATIIPTMCARMTINPGEGLKHGGKVKHWRFALVARMTINPGEGLKPQLVATARHNATARMTINPGEGLKRRYKETVDQR